LSNAEYGWGEKPSAAGDVYSFGTVLLELFSRWVQSALKKQDSASH